MARPMRCWIAACAAIWMSAAGCGGGTTANPDVAPKITSTPPTTATVGVPYNYTVSVEGMTPIVFALVSGPEGFEVHPSSGIVTWIPTEAGTASIEVSASNIAGSDTQSFDVTVNLPTGPVFTTEPPSEATVAAPYAYDPMVVADGTVTWSAPVAPVGLGIDADTGAVRWTPTSSQTGDQAVTIRATEVDGGLSTASHEARQYLAGSGCPQGHGRANADRLPGWQLRRLRAVPIRSSPPRGPTLQWQR